MDNSTVSIMLKFHKFGTPTTPKSKTMQVNYDKIIGGDLTNEVREMLKLATQQRRLLVQGLSYAGATPNPLNLIEAVNAYLPYVWRIQKSLEYSKDTKIRIMAPLHFEWTSAIVNPLVAEKSQAQSVFVYEVSFLLAVKALSHYNYARQIVERIYQRELETKAALAVDDELITSCFKQAIQELRVGAGVLNFAVDSVLVNWKRPPPVLLPETDMKVLKALSTYFCCQAQRLMIAKAVMKNQTSILPKLLMGLGDKYSACLSSLASPYLEYSLRGEAALMRVVTESLAAKYSAIHIAERVRKGTDIAVDEIEKQFGIAVGFANLSSKFLQIDLQSMEFIDNEDYRPYLKGEAAELRRIIQEMESENNTVYYSRVDPSEAELPKRSEFKFVITAEEFKMQEVEALSFEEIVRAPPGYSQEQFNQLPKEIQTELLEQHRVSEAQRKADEKKQKKKGGLFGKSKEKPKAAPQATITPSPVADASDTTPLQAPPGTDKSVFDSLPRSMQIEIINNYKNGGGI